MKTYHSGLFRGRVTLSGSQGLDALLSLGAQQISGRIDVLRGNACRSGAQRGRVAIRYEETPSARRAREYLGAGIGRRGSSSQPTWEG